jgi:hypothetical protein
MRNFFSRLPGIDDSELDSIFLLPKRLVRIHREARTHPDYQITFRLLPVAKTGLLSTKVFTGSPARANLEADNFTRLGRRRAIFRRAVNQRL